MASTVLIVEDDPDAVKLVGLYLRRDGHKVVSARDGLEGLRLAREARPDLVVLDLMLPKLDGIEVCRALRQESDVPVVMVTARVEEEDRLAGLELGADDYVTKPFSPRELAARIRAVLRRTARDALERGPAEISYGDVTVDLHGRTAYVNGDKVALTPTEFPAPGHAGQGAGEDFSPASRSSIPRLGSTSRASTGRLTPISPT